MQREKNKDQKETIDNALGDFDKRQFWRAIGKEAAFQWIKKWKVGDKGG